MKALIRSAIYASAAVSLVSGSSHAQTANESAAVAGQWKEYWGTPGQTDVDYNDLYRVSIAADGQAKVELVEKDWKITDVELKENGIAFTQHTNFAVRYTLQLQPDHNGMIGTALTPTRIVNIRWERAR